MIKHTIESASALVIEVGSRDSSEFLDFVSSLITKLLVKC